MPSNKVQNNEQAEYKGEPLDDELANGPMAKRSCTDPICCLLFVAFIGGMIGVAAYGLANGNPNLIGRGYDSDGKMCGIDTGYEDYKYLYWPRPGLSYRTDTVCLKSCPTGYNTPASLASYCHTNTDFAACTQSGPAASESAIATRCAAGSCSGEFYIYTTYAFVSRFCVPSAVDFSSVTSTFFDSDVLEQWISDIRSTWPIILASIGVAFVIGFVYMIFLKYCSGVLTWLAIIAFIVGAGVLGWRFYSQANTTSDSSSSAQSSSTSGSSTINSQKIIAYVCWGVAGLTALAVLCLWSRIRLAIAIMKAAADYVKATPTIFLVPVFTGIILVCLFGYWGLTAVYLVSCGDAKQLSNTPVGTFEFNTNLKRFLIYHLFGLLWFNAFVIAATQFIMASSTALWYFSQGTGQNATGTVSTSVKRVFRYHFGSIAFGSLILAIVQMIRIILAYMEAQAKKMAGKDSKIIVYTLRCLQCYVACFERFIKFLNKNAYIQMALTGKNFCLSAKDAFFLILRNPLRFSIVGGIGSIFVLFGKVAIGAITALIGFLVITKVSTYSDSIYSPFIPTLLMFIFAYVVAACFMTVYGMAADTILACFIVDEEIHSKKNAPPLHCPESLRTFLQKNKKN